MEACARKCHTELRSDVSVSSCSRQQVVSISAHRRVNISRYCLTCAGQVYQSAKAPSCQRNRATRSRGWRGAGSEAARDRWWHIEKPRRREQSVRSRARPVIPACVIPLFNVWRSVEARSRTQRSTALRSAVPVSFHCLLSQ